MKRQCVRPWPARGMGTGNEVGEWERGLRDLRDSWRGSGIAPSALHYQFRMQFGGQTNRQWGENRGIPTI